MILHRPFFLALVVFVSACGADPRAVPEIARSLKQKGEVRAAEIVLGEVQLATQGDFDAFERNVLDRIGPKQRVTVYEGLIAPDRPGTARNDALILQRLMLIYLDFFSHSSLTAEDRVAFQRRGRAVLDQLIAKDRSHPHTLFAQSYIRQKLLNIRGQGFRIDKLGSVELGMQSARELRTLWSKLLKLAPDYDGPRDMDATWIREELKELERVFRQKTGEIRPALFQPERPDNSAVAVARETLWELERKKPRQYGAICEDFRKAVTTMGLIRRPATLAEAEVSSRCGKELVDAKLMLAGLALTPPGTEEFCGRLRPVACEAAEMCSEFDVALESTVDKLSACWGASRLALLVLELISPQKRRALELMRASGILKEDVSVQHIFDDLGHGERGLEDVLMEEIVGRKEWRNASVKLHMEKRRHGKVETWRLQLPVPEGSLPGLSKASVRELRKWGLALSKPPSVEAAPRPLMGALLGAGIDLTYQKVGTDGVLIKARDRIGRKFGVRRDISLVFRETPEGWKLSHVLLDRREADDDVSAGEMDEVFSHSWAFEPAVKRIKDEGPGSE